MRLDSVQIKLGRTTGLKRPKISVSFNQRRDLGFRILEANGALTINYFNTYSRELLQVSLPSFYKEAKDLLDFHTKSMKSSRAMSPKR